MTGSESQSILYTNKSDISIHVGSCNKLNVSTTGHWMIVQSVTITE